MRSDCNSVKPLVYVLLRILYAKIERSVPVRQKHYYMYIKWHTFAQIGKAQSQATEKYYESSKILILSVTSLVSDVFVIINTKLISSGQLIGQLRVVIGHRLIKSANR